MSQWSLCPISPVPCKSDRFIRAKRVLTRRRLLGHLSGILAILDHWGRFLVSGWGTLVSVSRGAINDPEGAERFIGLIVKQNKVNRVSPCFFGRLFQISSEQFCNKFDFYEYWLDTDCENWNFPHTVCTYE